MNITFQDLLQRDLVNHLFQPITDISDKSIIGYESLLRCEMVQSPLELFQLAVKFSKLYELDTFSIRKVARHFNTYLYHSNDMKNIWINIFPSTLIHPHFPSFLKSLLTEVRIPTDKIILELNEAEYFTDLSLVKKVVMKLKSEGFKIAIDDYGKGVSTAHHLIELEPDIVKIDKYFAIGLGTTEKKRHFVEGMLHFFGDSQNVILEGIETEKDLAAAKSIGIQYAQGFHLAMPSQLDCCTKKLCDF